MIITNKEIESTLSCLRNYAIHLTNKNINEAEELIQNTILKMIEKKDKYKDKYTVLNWGAGIMHNLFIDDKRNIKKKGYSSYIEDIKIPDSKLSSIFQESNDLIIRQNCREIKLRYRKMLRMKNTNKKSVEKSLQYFILRGFGLSHKEIGEYLDVDTNWVKLKAHSVKKELRTNYMQNINI